MLSVVAAGPAPGSTAQDAQKHRDDWAKTKQYLKERVQRIDFWGAPKTRVGILVMTPTGLQLACPMTSNPTGIPGVNANQMLRNCIDLNPQFNYDTTIKHNPAHFGAADAMGALLAPTVGAAHQLVSVSVPDRPKYLEGMHSMRRPKPRNELNTVRG